MSLLSSGTLIIIIPSNQGVIVAAGSLSSAGNKILKNRKKLQFPTRHRSLILTVTGHSEFYPIPSSMNMDLEDRLKMNNPKFSAPNLLLSHIDSKSVIILNENLLNETAELLSSQLNQYAQSSPESIKKFQGKEIFRPVLIQYLTQSETTIIGTFIVLINHRNEAKYSKINIQRLDKNDERFIGIYGEYEYVNQNVLKPNSIGSKFLPSNIESLWNEPKTVKDMSAKNASEIAMSLIKATENTSKFIPIESAVGGKPTILLMNDKIVSI